MWNMSHEVENISENDNNKNIRKCICIVLNKYDMKNGGLMNKAGIEHTEIEILY